MSIKVKINNDWVDTNIQAVRGVNHVNSEDVYTKQESDALFSGKVSKSDIIQSTGISETAVMSQKAISDALSKKADLINSKQTIRADVTWTNDIYLGDETYKISLNDNGDLTYNGDKVMVGSTVSNEVSLVQNTGQSTTSVMSQKAVSDIVDELHGQLVDIIGGRETFVPLWSKNNDRMYNTILSIDEVDNLEIHWEDNQYVIKIKSINDAGDETGYGQNWWWYIEGSPVAGVTMECDGNIILNKQSILQSAPATTKVKFIVRVDVSHEHINSDIVNSKFSLSKSIEGRLDKVEQEIKDAGKINSISINEEAIPVDDDKNVDIPLASETKSGVIDAELFTKINNAISDRTILETIDVVQLEHAVLSDNTGLSTNTIHSHSKPVFVQKGSTIKSYARLDSVAYSAIAITDIDESFYRSVVSGSNTGEKTERIAVVDEDCYITCSYRTDLGITLVVDSVIISQLTKNTENIEDLNKKVNELVNTDKVQSYFNEELAFTISTIQEHSNKPCLVLPIVTDAHEDLSSEESQRWVKETFENLRAVSSNVYIDGIVSLGDYLVAKPTNYPDWNKVNAHLDTWRRRFLLVSGNVFMCVGNHDGINGKTPQEHKTYHTIGAFNQGYVERNGINNYFFWDCKALKVRCIFLATNTYQNGSASQGLDAAQREWLVKEALNTEDGWSVMLFSHIAPVDYDFGYGSAMRAFVSGYLNAYNNHTRYVDTNGLVADFTDNTSTKVIAWIAGHGHYDRVIYEGQTAHNGGDVRDIVSTYKFPVIQISCNKKPTSDYVPEEGVQPSRTAETATQDLWDTLVYVPDDNKVYMVRFGAGEDRVVNVQ